MSGLNLRDILFYTPEEVALIFRRTLRHDRIGADGTLHGRAGDPDVEWAYKAARRFLKPAVRRFGRKQTLFLKSEVDRIVAEGVPILRRTGRKASDVNAQKRHRVTNPESPGTEGYAEGGGSDAEAKERRGAGDGEAQREDTGEAAAPAQEASD